MPRIFLLSGSRRGERSATLQLMRWAAGKMQHSIDDRLHIEDSDPSRWLVLPCLGCSTCFYQGSCALDGVDDLPLLRQKMLDADMLVIGSPVYVAGVTGDMKLLLDRLALWTHTMPLLGKPVLVAATANNNHLAEVLEQLEGLVTAMGGSLVGRLAAYTDRCGQLPDEAKLDEDNRAAVNSAVSCLSGGELPVSQQLQQYFSARNLMYLNALLLQRQNGCAIAGEFELWRQAGLYRYPTADQAVAALMRPGPELSADKLTATGDGLGKGYAESLGKTAR